MPGSQPFRVLIADDEPLALDLLRGLLASTPDNVVVGEAADGDEVVAQAARLQPDAVILDINMPGRSGIEAALGMTDPHRPEMIFLTAHAHHAASAFELAAADYLLKPVRLERLKRALDRARRLRLARVQPPPAPDGGTDFWAPGRKGLVRVPLDSVRWIRAAKDHVFLNTDGQSHMLRTTMAELEERLRGTRMVRVHRSIFVQLAAVREIRRGRKSIHLVLEDGAAVPVGPSYVDAVADGLGWPINARRG